MTRNPDRLGLETAEQSLERLLAAAAAPAHPHELTGEEAAVAAYVRARVAAPTIPVVRISRVAPRLVAAAVLSVAGVVVATTGGAPMAPGPQPTPVATRSPLFPLAPGVPRTGFATPPNPADSSENSLPGKCRAYLKFDPDKRQRRLTTPGFERVVEAAGGVDRVDAYCSALTGIPSGSTAGPKPGKPHGNDGRPPGRRS